MAHGSLDGEWWTLVAEYVKNNRGHESSDTASSPGLLEDPSPKLAQETLKLSEWAKPLPTPISACDFDFGVWGFAAQTTAPSTDARRTTMSARQWLGTRSTPAKMAGLRETLSHQQCAPSERWGPRSNKPLRERHHATRVALAPPQSQQRLLQTSSSMKVTPASTAYPGQVLLFRPSDHTWPRKRRWQPVLAGGESP
jgi:hypothetical protein